jgi:hypothetical protein
MVETAHHRALNTQRMVLAENSDPTIACPLTVEALRFLRGNRLQ